MDIMKIIYQFSITAISIACLVYCIIKFRQLSLEKDAAKKSGKKVKMKRVSKVHDRSSLNGNIEVEFEVLNKKFFAIYEYSFEGKNRRVKVVQESEYFDNEIEEVINTETGRVITMIDRRRDLFSTLLAISLGLSLLFSFFSNMLIIGLIIGIK